MLHDVSHLHGYVIKLVTLASQIAELPPPATKIEFALLPALPPIRDPCLALQSTTHKSWWERGSDDKIDGAKKDNPNPNGDNGFLILGKLGRSVFDMYATQMLLKRYPGKTWKALAVSEEFRSRYGTLIR